MKEESEFSESSTSLKRCSLTHAAVWTAHYSWLFLCDVSQSHDGLRVDSHGQRCSYSAMYGQDLDYWLNAVRVTSVPQNLEEQDHVLGVTLNNSLGQKVLNGLWEDGRYDDVGLLCP